MSHYELWSLVIAALTLGALSATLWVLIGYAKDTATLAKCAVEQTPRPCVSVLQLPDQSTMAVLESVATSIDNLKTVVLLNIGTTRALNVKFWIGAPGPGANREFTSGAPIGCGERSTPAIRGTLLKIQRWSSWNMRALAAPAIEAKR